jgi:hypothetical protein
MDPTPEEPHIEMIAAVGTESAQVYGFGPGAGPAPALQVGLARGRPGGVWATADVISWVRPSLLSAVVVPVGLAWRPGRGQVRGDLGVHAGPALTVSGPPTWRSDDAGGWEPASRLRAAGWLGVTVGGSVRIDDRTAVFLRGEQAFQLSWGVAGVPLLPHRMLFVGIQRNLAGEP